MIQRFIQEEEGQGLTEYGLIVVFIVVALIGVWLIYRNTLMNGVFEPASNSFVNATQ